MVIRIGRWAFDLRAEVWRLRVDGNTRDGQRLERVVEIPFRELMSAREPTWKIKERRQEEAVLNLATRLHELEQDGACA